MNFAELGDRYNQDLSLKLIGRYQLNAALDFDGSLIKDRLSFKDYLFNGIPELANGVLSNWQNQQYDSKYSELKQQMLGNRLYDAGNKHNKYKIRFIAPCSYSRRKWNGNYDCYELPYRTERFVSDANKYLLLEKIALDENIQRSVSIESIDSFRYLGLFEYYPISLRYRENGFMYSDTYQQQIICINFLRNVQLNDFGSFLQAVDYRKKIKEHLFIIGNIKITCRQTLLSTHNIVNDFLPQLVTLNVNTKSSCLLSEYSPDDVIIEEIEENTTNELPQENRDFIFNISGYKIHVSRFDSSSKKHVIAYFGNK